MMLNLESDNTAYAVVDDVPVTEDLFWTLKALASPEGQAAVREEIDKQIIADLLKLAKANNA